MFWCELFLLTSATTALVVNGLIQDLYQKQDDLGIELLQERKYFDIDSLEDLIDADGNLVNNTGMLRDYGMEISSDKVNTMMEIGKKCLPTVSCTRLGGYCVKKKSDCNGTLDKYGCRGNKNCKCCIPDDIICGPVSTTLAPCTSITTDGPTVSPNVTWLSACSDRFVRFDQTMSWMDARNLCMSHGLDLFQPKDCVCVAKYLEELLNEDTSWHWLGGRADGTYMKWLSGEILETDDECWRQTGFHRNRGSNACLWMISNNGWDDNQNGVYNTQDESCSRSSSFKVLCG